MNDELELRVAQHTEELETANRRLREAQAELAHINLVMTMGEWTTSIAHEVEQPLAAIVNKANAGIRFLRTQLPDLEEVHQALVDIAEQGTKAGDVISRIRAQAKRGGACQGGSGHQPIYPGERPTIPRCPNMEAVIQSCHP